jgi:hypothetical protein
MNAQVSVSRGWSAMSEEGEGGAFILRLKASRYCAETSTLGTSDAVSVLPRGFLETQQ